MISLRAYRLLEDAWTDGVMDWCRAATPFVLGGGRAWMVTVSDGQTNWIKQRLLAHGISLFGVQFLDARLLRRELCLRAGVPAPTLGVETLRFLLRLHASNAATPSSEWTAVARHPEACFSALDDFAAAGWLNEVGLVDRVLPATIGDWLPQLRASGSWTPDIDRRLANLPTTDQQGPLSICVFGWDAKAWSRFQLLRAAVRAATSAYLYFPLSGGAAEAIQHAWLDACELAFGVERVDCEESGFVSAQATLAARLEGADFDATRADVTAPELLTGVDSDDTVVLVRDYVARWLADNPSQNQTAADGCHRLAILCPRRGSSSASVVRALTAADIAVEDELGELPQRSLIVQIQRAIVDYHLSHAGLPALLALVELLNEHVAFGTEETASVLRDVFPVDALEVRRAMRGAFAEVQHHSARLLAETVSFARTPVARSLRGLIVHLGAWPRSLPWSEALARWQQTLARLGLVTEHSELLWSRLGALSVPEPVPFEAFFQYLAEILDGIAARRDPAASERYARVVVTTLAGAAGQTWGGLVFLDSNEGRWPLYPPENPFLGDTHRRLLNARRDETNARGAGHFRGYLLTASDRARIEQFHFLEILQNCRGPLAFASASRDPADPSQELQPNEWLLRCLVETPGAAALDAGTLLERWRRTIRQTRRTIAPLPKGEQNHLREVWTTRRDPQIPFDQYFFNFVALTDPDELPWAEAWSAGELDAAWNRPATFALTQIFDAKPSHADRSLTRGESWAVGRLVHRWLHVALEATREPRQVRGEDWSRALTQGLSRARAQTEADLRARLRSADPHPTEGLLASGTLPLWWQGVLHKATWATRRCLETLAENVARQGDAPLWLCVNQNFQGEVATAAGRLRLRARCDVVLLDGPDLAGAVCQLVDIRTGATPANAASSASHLTQGKGLHSIATLLLAVAAGADPDRTRAGTVHPDTNDLSLAMADVAPLAAPALERLASLQRTLVFGQKGALADAHNPLQAETLPLATTPVDPLILAAKAQITECKESVAL